MAKLDKTNLTKEQAAHAMTNRRLVKQQQLYTPPLSQSKSTYETHVSFVLGNGTSRASIDPEKLREYGKIYGCNALYRTFNPDYLVAVDTKMILEIYKTGYQNYNEVWTNPNRAYTNIKNINYFNPSKGWSSGPTALWLASQHKCETIFILGFDYKGLEDGKKVNNMYADTKNYKKSSDSATFFGNWLRQTVSVVKENPKIQYYRVIASDNYIPSELNNLNNLKHVFVEDFQKMFNIFQYFKKMARFEPVSIHFSYRLLNTNDSLTIGKTFIGENNSRSKEI